MSGSSSLPLPRQLAISKAPCRQFEARRMGELRLGAMSKIESRGARSPSGGIATPATLRVAMRAGIRLTAPDHLPDPAKAQGFFVCHNRDAQKMYHAYRGCTSDGRSRASGSRS
jgi:hypothetical protein